MRILVIGINYAPARTSVAPFTTGLCEHLASRVTDLASDAALSTGIMKNSVCIRLARAFEAFTYRKALAVICLCQGFIERLRERGVHPEKLHLIPDWCDTKGIRPQVRDASFRQVHDIAPSAFLVLHTG